MKIREFLQKIAETLNGVEELAQPRATRSKANVEDYPNTTELGSAASKAETANGRTIASTRNTSGEPHHV